MWGQHRPVCSGQLVIGRSVLLGSATAVLCLGLVASTLADNLFTETTASAGLDAEFFASPTRHSLGVVWFDANGDGHPDIFATNGFDPGGGPSIRPHLYLSDGNGAFQLRDDLLPTLANYDYPGALAADYDRDGDTDLFVYTANELFSTNTAAGNPLEGPPNMLLQNQLIESGTSSFIDVAVSAGLDDSPEELLSLMDPGSPYDCYQTRTATFFDYDLDGWIDLYVGHMVMNRAASLTDPIADETGKLFNADTVYRNNRDGTFSIASDVLRAGDATRRSALVARSGYIDDDFWPDVYVGNVGKDVIELAPSDVDDVVLLNDGNGHLDPAYPTIGSDTPAAMGIDFADINGDLRFDVYVTDVLNHVLNDPTNAGNTLYLTSGGDYLSNSAIPYRIDANLSWGCNFADFDLDGTEVLFVGSAASSVPSILFDVASVPAPAVGAFATTDVRGSALADYDRDEDLDLLVVNQDGGLQLFRNDSVRNGNVPLVIRGIPWRTNSDGIGLFAEVLTTQGLHMIRQIKGGSSAHSNDYPEMHFGIPAGDSVASVTVRWPYVGHPIQTIAGPLSGTLIVDERDASCPCEFDGEAGVTVTDLLEFLSNWFVGNQIADLQGDGTVDVIDLLEFLACWFAPGAGGCQ